jgi:GDPmannose 4,6-dehydratase
MSKNVLIVGSEGQDGRLLSQKLTALGDRVRGLNRNNFDITNQTHVFDLIHSTTWDEVYFLAAHHSSSESVLIKSTYQDYVRINHQAPLYFIEAIRLYSPSTRFFFANSSHLYGKSNGSLLSEDYPKQPICFYGQSKYLTMQDMIFYRRQFKLFLINGILFNHESSLRSNNFLSKKIINKAFEIKKNSSGVLILGNPEQAVDWGSAHDYVEGFIKIMRQDKAGDFVISSGELHTVREFVEIVFRFFNLDYLKNVLIDPSLIEGVDRGVLFGDNRKIKDCTDWEPKSKFKDWIEKMCLDALKSEKGQ